MTVNRTLNALVKHAAVWIAASVSLLGCAITETGNPQVASGLALVADSSSSEHVSIGGGSGAIRVDHAWLTVGDVRFVLGSSCDGNPTRVDLPGPTSVDLVANPRILELDLAASEYCRIRVPFVQAEPPLPAGAPTELDGATLVVTGTLADGTPWSLRSHARPELDVNSHGMPFRVDDAHRAMLLAFDLATWFDGVPIETAMRNAEGRIVLDDGRNHALLTQVENNLRSAARLFSDVNRDGHLDPGDRAALLANSD